MASDTERGGVGGVGRDVAERRQLPNLGGARNKRPLLEGGKQVLGQAHREVSRSLPAAK